MILLKTLKEIRFLLPKSLQFKAISVLVSLLALSIMDLLGLGALVPLIILVVDESTFTKDGIVKDLFDLTQLESQITFIMLFAALILVIILIKNVLAVVIQYWQSKFAYTTQHKITMKMFTKYLKKEVADFKDSTSNQLYQDVVSTSGLFSSGVLLPFIQLLNEVLILLFVVTGLLIYNWQVVIVVGLVIVPAFWLFNRSLRSIVQKIGKRIFNFNTTLLKLSHESFFGLRDIKITQTEEFFVHNYSVTLKKKVDNQAKDYVIKQSPTRMTEVMVVLALVIIIGVGLTLNDSRSELITFLGVFALAAYRVLPSINRMLIALTSIRTNQFVFETLNESKKIQKEEVQNETKLVFSEVIKVRDLNFSYDKTQVLNNISFEINKGERVGIIGTSGSGKTTLMNVMLMFASPQSGSVFIDDYELSVKDKSSWWKLIGFVPQDIFIRDGSLEENIAFGIEPSEIDFNRLHEVIDRAQLNDFINTQPNGLKTKVGEHGAKISGGQKQRIGIARALYSGAQIMFFDEATSALDTNTENQITEAINDLNKHNITSIVVAHRYSTLKYCDKIILLENGRIKEVLTYQELQKRSE